MTNNQFMEKIEALIRLMGHSSFKISDLTREDVFRLEREIKFSKETFKETSVETRVIGAYPGKIIRTSEYIDIAPFIKSDINMLHIQIASCIYSAFIFISFGLLLSKFAWYILPVFVISTLTSLFLASQVYKDLKMKQQKSPFSNRVYVDMPVIVEGNVQTITHDNGTYELCATHTDYIAIQMFRVGGDKGEGVLEIIIEQGLQA